MKIYKIFADFNNADARGRVRLTTTGSRKDIHEQKIELTENMKVLLADEEELQTYGIIKFSIEENIWVAIDWNKFIKRFNQCTNTTFISI